MLDLEIITGSAARSAFRSSTESATGLSAGSVTGRVLVTGRSTGSATGGTSNSFKIYALDPEFYSGQDTHKHTHYW